jgi:tetratricopeptide (TPR) repeat protein
MEHPNIARVLDAGATETGRPFFVMELVKGDPIVEYCDRNNLSIEERLELFAQVCNAVQHAHTKGIIHRDIKPSNILVSTQDGRPHTKVIDFGIAKATASKLTEKTLFTEHKALIGTPEYMSPEQAEGSLDIDTRTDVYSLGVLLYELLTGTTPFSGKELRSAAYAEIQRIIREVEPPKPSTRLSATTDTIASVAAKRHTEPKRLGNIVRGELDWIVMKALEKDRQRRYETANGLGMDIRRYLNGEAILAAPPSQVYRIRKFVRRNKGPVIAGSGVAAALLIGVVAFAWQARVASDQRDIAVAAQKAEAEQREQAEAAQFEAQAQEAEAKKQAAIADAVAKFQTDMLAAADPYKLLGDRVTVVQAMEAAVKELDSGALKDQPMVEAGVRETIGRTLNMLSRFRDAEPNLRQSLALRRAFLPAGHPDIAVGLHRLALALKDQYRLAEAESLAREALEIRRAALPSGDRAIAGSLIGLSLILMRQNRLTEAEPLLRESLEIHRAALPAGHTSIALSLYHLAILLIDQNRLAEAEPLLREALEIRRGALPAESLSRASTLFELGRLLQAQNRLEEAEPLFRETLRIHRAGFPAGHPDIAIDLNSLAILIDLNRLDEAEPLLREALEIDRAVLPAGHLNLAVSLYNLGRLLHAQNKFDEAEPLFREALESVKGTKHFDHHWVTWNARSLLGGVLLGQNRLAEAEPLLLEGYRGMKDRETEIPPGSRAFIPQALERLVRLYQAMGNQAEAEAWRIKLGAAKAEFR